jgi:CheY-like chemotaxis protein
MPLIDGPLQSAFGVRATTDGTEDSAPITVLVVEDDAAVADVLCWAIEDLPGWRAEVVHDPLTAMERLGIVPRPSPRLQRAAPRPPATPVDLLLTDVNLPGMSGPALVTQLRRDPRRAHLPVLLMSATAPTAEAEAQLRRGEVTGFIAKPFDLDRLIETLEWAVGAGTGAEERSPAAADKGQRAA